MRSGTMPRREGMATCRWVVGLAVCILFASADSASAQRGRGGVGRRAQETKPAGPIRGTVDAQSIDQPGTYKGQISKFEPLTSEQDEELIGVLTLRPQVPGSKTLKLQVRKTENLRIVVGSHSFDPEACADILWKGLYCSAEWDWFKKEGESEKKKPTVRELRTLTFESLPVEGTIEEMEGEFITVKVRPREGRDWPDSPATGSRSSNSRSGSEGETKRVLQKKLRLKIMDEVSSFADAARQALDLGDFTPAQQVMAVVMYGKKQGVLIELQSLTAEENKEGGESAQKKSGDAHDPRIRGGGRGGRLQR